MEDETSGIRYRAVNNRKILEEFQNKAKCIITYRSAMKGEEGKYYPPMATKGGEGMEPGVVYKSEEHPEKRNAEGKIVLEADMRDFGAEGEVPAAYNPSHARNMAYAKRLPCKYLRDSITLSSLIQVRIK